MMQSEKELSVRCEQLVKLFAGAPIAQTYGMTLRFNEKHQAIFELPYNANFDHALHGIHGGVLATMLDNAGWFTAAAHFSTWIATVEMQVRFLEPVEKEFLYSIGNIVRLGKSLVICDMEVRTKSERLIAVGSGTFIVTSKPFELAT